MKYTEIHIKPFVNVSSSYDYFVNVLFKINGLPVEPGRFYWSRFHLNSEMFLLSGDDSGYDRSIPKYAILEVLRQLRCAIENEDLKPYEYNRDGSKRWDNLKYYDAAELREWSEKWPA